MAFDNGTFIKLIFKNERKILNGKTAKDIREAIEFFRSPGVGGVSQRAKETFRLATDRSTRALEAMGLSMGFEFSDDPVLNNKIWKEQVRPMQEVLREIFEYEMVAAEFKLPNNSTKEQINELLTEIRLAKEKKKAEEKKRAQELRAKKMKAQKKQAAIRAEQLARETAIRKEQLDKENEARRKRLGLDAEADPELAEKLFKSAEQGIQSESINYAGYLYFKVWVLPDGSKWYKIGITNDLRRRDAEQNVLPVPATTLKSVRFFSIEHARIVEKKFLDTLSNHRIKGANNKELLSLKPEQVQAIVGAMKAIKSCTF